MVKPVVKLAGKMSDVVKFMAVTKCSTAFVGLNNPTLLSSGLVLSSKRCVAAAVLWVKKIDNK